MSIPQPLRGRCPTPRATAVSLLATSDGIKVEGEAQGDEESLQKLLKDLNRGPSLAHVVKVEKSEQEVKEGEHSFEAK